MMLLAVVFVINNKGFALFARTQSVRIYHSYVMAHANQ